MKELLATNLARVLIVLPLVMLANNLFGAVLSKFNDKYDKDRLKAGIKKGLVVYGGIGIYVVVALYLPELMVEFNGDTYGLIDAIYVIVWGTLGLYTGDGLLKLKEIFKFKTGDVE